MKIRNTLYAEEGMMLTDGTNYGSIVNLEIGVPVDKYYEITMTEYEEIVRAKEAELLSNPDNTEDQEIDSSMDDLDDIPGEDFSANHDDAPKVV